MIKDSAMEVAESFSDYGMKMTGYEVTQHIEKSL